MSDSVIRKEIQEAIEAGEDALYSLYGARDQLSGARNWGIADLLGGGLAVNLIKHSKINKARKCLEDAKYKLKKFQNELRDVTLMDRINIDVSDFLSFADFFFDGLAADYLVQSRINEARGEVDYAIRHAEELVAELRARLTQY